MKKTIYKNRKCPTHKNCWGYKDSSCNDCDYGNKFIRLHNKIYHLKKKLEKAEKATADVAREIFKELIDNATFIEYADGGRYLRFNAEFFAELKKKYTEGNDADKARE